jgi:methionine synthase II (cobalamin-independent)
MTVAVHLVGSVGLEDVDAVFATASQTLGASLARIPDGEPGGRRLWISWQYPLLRANPFLKVDSAYAQKASAGLPKLRLGDGVEQQELQFGELGYAREARASYQDFLRARDRKIVNGNTRFQVCLPTPLAVIDAFSAPDAVIDIEQAYETAMRKEVAKICAEIPHRDLSIQWDLCVEMILWDARSGFYSKVADKSGIIERVNRLCREIPGDVELGFHLCYGDFEAKHFIEPLDAESMMSLGNELVESAGHKVSFIHMPVPIARTDDAFFAPLKRLALPTDCQLFLGIVHAADGVAGALNRANAAHKAVASFGIATECGLGRCKTPDDVRKLLDLHAAIAQQMSH